MTQHFCTALQFEFVNQWLFRSKAVLRKWAEQRLSWSWLLCQSSNQAAAIRVFSRMSFSSSDQELHTAQRDRELVMTGMITVSKNPWQHGTASPTFAKTLKGRNGKWEIMGAFLLGFFSPSRFFYDLGRKNIKTRLGTVSRRVCEVLKKSKENISGSILSRSNF